MRIIELNRREARLLRENMTVNQEGYDYTDLLRLDHLAKRLVELQGEYAERMAELTREERQANRARVRAATQAETEAADRILLKIQYEVEDLSEDAEGVNVEFFVEDGDYNLIVDKLAAVQRWRANDGLRHVIIGMIEGVRSARTPDADQAIPVELAAKRKGK